jgi:hypothetical protein
MGDNAQNIETSIGLMEPSYIAKKMIDMVEDDKLNGIVRFVAIKSDKDYKPLKVARI